MTKTVTHKCSVCGVEASRMEPLVRLNYSDMVSDWLCQRHDPLHHEIHFEMVKHQLESGEVVWQ